MSVWDWLFTIYLICMVLGTIVIAPLVIRDLLRVHKDYGSVSIAVALKWQEAIHKRLKGEIEEGLQNEADYQEDDVL